jgi:hypothetical protein
MDSLEKPKQNQEEPQEAKLDWKSKILFAFVGILIIGSVAATYWRIVVKRDYIIQAQIDCDPETENCFVWKCDPSSTVEGEACTGDPENDVWYYKILRRNANNIPLCDPDKDENCTAYVCDSDEKDCSEELCIAKENVPEGEVCNDPVQYNIDNPPEEGSDECAPGDQECLDNQSSEEACPPDDESCQQDEEADTAPDDNSSE